MDAELATIICQRIAAGESLRAICRDQGMPAESSIRYFVAEDQAFAAQYARARQVGLDCIAEETITIADDMSIPADQKRHMIDSRKWFASKLRPDKYGDTSRLELTGANGGAIELSVAETLRSRRAERLKAISGTCYEASEAVENLT